MLVNQLIPLVLCAVLSSGSSAPSSEAYASRSCAELGALREDTDAAASRLAAWMERHCPGALEQTQPFCRLQSRGLLERLDELGELKALLHAKGCPGRDIKGVSAGRGDGRVDHPANPPLSVEHPRSIGSFDDNWPWPRRPTFQAGLAASAAFRIRKCRADPDCEW